MSSPGIITKLTQLERLIRTEHKSLRHLKLRVGAVISLAHSCQIWTVSCRDGESHHKDVMLLQFIMVTQAR
jgi:hypothetical protein